jgi:hypothetical protein
MVHRSCYQGKPDTSQYCYYFTQNVVVDWLTILLLIQEVLGSNLGLETTYSDWGFCGFTQYLEANAGYYFKLGHDPIFRILSRSSFTCHIVLDSVLCKTPRGIRINLTSRLEDLDYADDVCLLSHTWVTWNTNCEDWRMKQNKHCQDKRNVNNDCKQQQSVSKQ